MQGEIVMIMGQIEEQRERFGQQCRQAQALDKQEAEERETKTIAAKFAEVLGHIEDAACGLAQVNEQYDPEQCVDAIRLVTRYGPYPCNPTLDFWLQADLAEEPLKNILRRLRRVAPLAPKERKVAL